MFSIAKRKHGGCNHVSTKLLSALRLPVVFFAEEKKQASVARIERQQIREQSRRLKRPPVSLARGAGGTRGMDTRVKPAYDGQVSHHKCDITLDLCRDIRYTARRGLYTS